MNTARKSIPIRDSALEHLAKVIWLGQYSKEHLMALFYAAYFDASASGKPSDTFPVLTVAGSVAPIKKWRRFEAEWSLVLSDEGVSEFHATDFAASNGEYVNWRGDKERRASFLRRLGKIIQQNVNRLFMVSVEVDAWNSVNSQYMLEESLYCPFALAGLSVLIQVRKWAKRKNIPEQNIQCVFEKGDPGWKDLDKLSSRHKFDPIELPKPKAIPCQIGDFVAWKNRIAATNSLRHLDKAQGGSNSNMQGLEGILTELRSLDKMLVSPGRPKIYSADSLIRTCEGSKIAKRAALL